jgi:predicted acylesterase/phospholipase RssA
MPFERVKFAVTKTFISSKGVWEFRAPIPFHGREKPLDVRITAGSSDLAQVKEFFDSLSLVSVQRQLWRDLGIREAGHKKEIYDKIDGMMISKDFSQDLKTISSEPVRCMPQGTVQRSILLSFLQAQHLRGDELAWVLSGGSDKGFAYPWIFEYLESLKLFPNYIYAVSAGTYFGGVYDYWQNAKKVINLVKGFVSTYDWQQCIDADLKGLRDPGTYKGFMTGKYLIQLLNGMLGLKGIYYSDMKIPFFTVSVNIHSGKPMIFCDPKYKSEIAYGPEDVTDYDYPVVSGIRASGGIPVAMAPFNINSEPVRTIDGKIITDLPPEMHVDGGIFENIPLKAALRNKCIRDIVLIHLGYTGERNDHVRNCVEVLLQTLDIEGISQLDIFESSKTIGTQIRAFNPRFFRLHALAGIQQAQRIGLSASSGMRDIISEIMEGKAFDREKFFSSLTMEQIRRAERVAKVKPFRDNVIYFEQKYPLIDDPNCPEMMKLIAADGGELIPKPVEKSAVRWLFDQMIEQFGWTRSIILGLDVSLHKLFFKLFFRK